MNFADIKKVFQDNGVPLTQDDVWKVQSSHVVKHKALERLSAAIKVQWEEPKFIRCERGEAVIYVAGRRLDKPEVMEWSIGEALIAETGKPGSNYKVSGNQASYVWAMAEKRGKDRVIIKLAGLHGAYSEEEADDFREAEREYEDGSKRPAVGRREQPRQEQSRQEQRQESEERRETARRPAPRDDRGDDRDQGASAGGGEAATEVEAELKRKIDEAETINAVTDFMLDERTQQELKGLGKAAEDDVREYAKARLRALGWPPARNGTKGQGRPRVAA